MWTSSKHIGTTLETLFRRTASNFPDLNVIVSESQRTKAGHGYKYHLYSLKKFFYSQTITEVGDAIAQAWCGRKAYLSTYIRPSLEERQRLYLKVMPRLTIFSMGHMKTEER